MNRRPWLSKAMEGSPPGLVPGAVTVKLKLLPPPLKETWSVRNCATAMISGLLGSTAIVGSHDWQSDVSVPGANVDTGPSGGSPSMKWRAFWEKSIGCPAALPPSME